MPRCVGTKPDGSPCERIVGASQTYCYAHDPANGDKRRRDAARAGRSTPNAELREVKGLLKKLTQQVLSGDLQTSSAAVANQLLNTRLRAIELERKWREIEQLEGRLEAVEVVLKTRGDRMKRNRLGRLYDHLTLEERFRLDVLALARGDKEESERLTDTCPRRNYTMNDWGFVGRWQAAQVLVMLAYMDLAKCLDKCQMIAAFRVVLPYLRTVWENYTHEAYFDGHHAGSRYAWRKAGKEGESPGWERDDEKAERNADPGLDEALDKWTSRVGAIDDKFSEKLDALERELAGKGLAAWSAFSDFCEQEMSLEAKKLLAAFANPFAERAGELENLAARLEVKPDPESVEEYRDILFEAWHRVLKKG